MKRPVIVLTAVLLLTGFGCAATKTKTENVAVASIDGASYVIDGKTRSLVKGKLEIFGAPTPGDLDGDGDQDAGVLLVSTPGGSGTFYYAAAVFNQDGRYLGSNAILLGDRVAPQNIAVSNGMIIANYAERNPGESMKVPPSVGVSRYIRVEDGKLSEIKKP